MPARALIASVTAIGGRSLCAAIAVALFVALGVAVGARPGLAVVAGCALFLIGALSIDLIVLPVLAFPAMLAIVRVGGTLSASDMMLFLATVCAVFMVRTRGQAELRTLLWICVGYQAALIPALVHNPYGANYVEWVHELFLVAGSLLIGWVVGESGRAGVALTLYVLPVAVLATWATLLWATGGFEPVTLLVFQKNALGDICALAGTIAYARPAWTGWSAAAGNLAVVVCGLGTLASGSRQGMISLAAGVLIIAIRGHVDRRRSRLILLAVIPLVVVAYTVTVDQLSSGDQFNSANQRLTWFGQSLDIWHTSQWFGVGLRWWYTGRFGVSFQPPNAEFEMLTSAGLVGLAAFAIASIAALRVLGRMNLRYGGLAFAVLAVRLVQGQLDLFWVASQSSLPWLVVGVCLGVLARDRRGAAGRPGTSDDRTSTRPGREPADEHSVGPARLAQRRGDAVAPTRA